jgi:hypothetical protein
MAIWRRSRLATARLTQRLLCWTLGLLCLLHLFECLAFRGNIEVRCKPSDLYVGVFGLGEGFGYSADRSVSPQNADRLAPATVYGLDFADDSFRWLAGQLATADFHVAGGYHSVFFVSR